MVVDLTVLTRATHAHANARRVNATSFLWTPLGKHEGLMNHEWEHQERVIGSHVYVLMFIYFYIMDVYVCVCMYTCRFPRTCVCPCDPVVSASPSHTPLPHNTCAVHLCSLCGGGCNTEVTAWKPEKFLVRDVPEMRYSESNGRCGNDSLALRSDPRPKVKGQRE